ncbi:MAG TPA: hypothetical protein VJT49_11835 [Amycolatopsis sp.]|uniref:hypothetical protein n=1 Tax=Amycolatopsis sp. TaxID=37632 RepID=UPI002B488006|nr:hypothetical protein [Amycolatopsis sp.]HKS45778.1 hypothetical protein [Amycolatopsis sp.]
MSRDTRLTLPVARYGRVHAPAVSGDARRERLSMSDRARSIVDSGRRRFASSDA